MQSLLRWSIENSTPYDSDPNAPRPPPPRNSNLNPEIIDAILGKPDAELMKEDMAVALDAEQSEDRRLEALDHLEMLIEQIDNANNLAALSLWEPLHGLLTSPTASSEIRVAALWVVGTALQNNPAAQDVYLKLCNPLSTLLSFLLPGPASSLSARSKALYTLSGLLKHNAPAVQQLDDAVGGDGAGSSKTGWEILKNALSDPEIQVRRKTAFLLNGLLVPSDPSEASSSPSAPPSSSVPQASAPAPAAPAAPLMLGPPTPQPSQPTTEGSQPQMTLTFRPADPSQPRQSAPLAAALHTSDAGPTTVPSSQSTSGPSLLTPAHLDTPSQNPDPIHPNSHAAYLRSPSLAQTSSLTKAGLEKYGIVSVVIGGLLEPLAWGEDGDQGNNGEGDVDFEEKSVRLLFTYFVACKGGSGVKAEEKTKLRVWIEKREAGGGGEGEDGERWGLTEGEVKALKSALV
ncbi:adenyl-nucleotide exchange factor [Coprinopsis sp. MPI-PUGE-AT-0042]|nr:adenyl-nucleotide exchange factor [Coprinopsis sp. MPI-PUGE-AT-0042]